METKKLGNEPAFPIETTEMDIMEEHITVSILACQNAFTLLVLL